MAYYTKDTLSKQKETQRFAEKLNRYCAKYLQHYFALYATPKVPQQLHTNSILLLNPQNEPCLVIYFEEEKNERDLSKEATLTNVQEVFVYYTKQRGWVKRTGEAFTESSYSTILKANLSDIHLGYFLKSEEVGEVIHKFSQEITFTLSANLEICAVSASIEGNLKYEREAILNKVFTTLVHPSDVELMVAKLQPEAYNTFDNKKNISICRLADANEKYNWFELYFSINHFAEDDFQWNILAKNVTAQYLADEALTTSQERYELAMLSGKVGIWSWDIEENTLQVSSQHKAVLGYGNSEIPDLPAAWLMLIHPKDKFHVIRNFVQCLNELNDTLELEFRMVNKEGTLLWMLARGRVLYNSTGPGMRLAGTITDITPQKETATALLESQSQLISTFASMSDMVLVLDELGRIKNYNQQFTIAFARQVNIINSDFEEVMLEALSNKVLTAFKLLKETRQTQSIDFSLSLSGEERFFHAKISVREEKRGQFLGATLVARDITERYKAAQQLHLLSSGIKAATNGVVIADALQTDLPLIYANPAFEKMTGYDKHEVLGRNCRFLQGEDRKQNEIKVLSKAIKQGENCSVLLQNYKKDGTLFYNQLEISPVFNEEGILTHYLGVQSDVTAKLKAEKATLEAKEQLEYIFNNLESVFLSVDVLKGKTIQVSKPCETIFGFTQQSLKENPTLWMELVHPEDKAILARQISLLSIGEGTTSELRIKNKKGEEIWLRVEIKPTMDAELGTTLIRTDAIFTNITAQKKQTQILKEKELAEKALSFKTQFLANMSHEIRTPLNGIIGIADLLVHKGLSEEQEHSIKLIQRSSENLLNILNDILDSSKLEAGKMTLKQKSFHIRNLFNRISELFHSTITRKEISFSLSIDSQVPDYIEADEVRLTQILTNLISNAINFTHRGGITLKVVLVEKQKLKVTVTDTGIGISVENQKKLFQQFSQIDQSSTREYGGTGLGLVICKQLVELMQGEIGVRSEEHKGSSFWFTFTYNEARQQPEITQKEHGNLLKNTLKDCHILLAEDKSSNQEVARLILTYLGCTVTMANNGIELLEKFKPKQFHLIFMDIQMPRMDGIEATKMLRAKYDQLPPIVGLSANAQENKAQYFIRLGMDDYLAKPITLYAISEKLKRWLPSHKFRQTTIEVSTIDFYNKINSMDAFNTKTLVELEKMAGSKQAVKEVLSSYLEDSQQLIAEIESAFKTNDNETLKYATHTLKGLSATVGAVRLHALSQKADAKLKKDDFSIKNEVESLKHAMAEALSFYQKHYKM